MSFPKFSVQMTGDAEWEGEQMVISICCSCIQAFMSVHISSSEIVIVQI